MEHHSTTPVHVETLQGNSSESIILKVSGPLTIHNFFEFRDLCRHQTPPILLIDLSGVPYLDSAALGSLVGVHVSRENAGKKYAVIGANSRLQSLFGMTKVSQFLITFPTLPEAEASLAL